jgi:excinuclease UvrABC nuclease subunit
LDRIFGLGIEGKQKLLAAFGTVENIRKQDDAALRAVISEEQVSALRRVL